MENKKTDNAIDVLSHLNSTSVSVFKIPKIPQKKPKMKVLTEEKYVEELGKLIQRDFFPDLEKLKAQNQYLEAFDRNDVVKLRELYAKYSGKKPTQHRPGFETPATFETPFRKSNTTPNQQDGLSNTRPNAQQTNSTLSPAHSITSAKSGLKATSPSDNHTLDSFLTHYTSEDNQSFEEIMENSDKKLRQKFSALFCAENEKAEDLENSLTLPSIEDQFRDNDKPKCIDTWTYRNKNYIMYVPDGVDLTKEEQLEMAKTKQSISYCNTRLQSNPFDDQQNKETIHELAKTQAKVLKGKVGVDGNTLNSNGTTEAQIRGFQFVKTPSPCPGVTDSPIMTWGEIEGTPFRLDGSDTPIRPQAGPSFRITETSRRENIALELAEKAAGRMRDQKAKAMETARRNMSSPHVRSSLDRLAIMSPAAKRLATTKLGIKDTLLSPSSLSSNHRLSTRTIITPKSIRKTTPSPLVRKKQSVTTPNTLSNTTPKLQETQEKTLLSDDLLKIPVKRNKASDFF